jgi:DNA repair photolyase
VRWDQLLIGSPTSSEAAEDERQSTPLPLVLPGAALLDGATARTFDTPEFRGMTFYEVRAKSIINRVPAASRVPFEWTINPYRGCSHACTYCLAGDTQILMADGRTKPLATLAVGDRIYGTVRAGAYRRYVHTEVLAHWSTMKSAYRVRLADGTALVASGDHRFLTDRGWKHVSGRDHGPGRRRHLTTANKLMGVGAFAVPPKDSVEYRRGYLYGLGRNRLTITDPQAAARVHHYLADFGCPAEEPGVDVVHALVERPAAPSPDWHTGYLAGVFDARGSHARGILRIASGDPAILAQTVEALRALDFDWALDHQPDITHVRLRGGVVQRMRFFHCVDPAVASKRDLAGGAVKSAANLRVASVEPLGIDLPMYDITTGTGDFIAGGVISHNCFARNTHTYLDLDAGHDFDTKVVVKVNAPDLLRRELTRPGWSGAHIAMGTNVDCYQRAEGRYRLMPGIIAALRDFANPFSILTKGTLILRDLDLLTQAASVTTVGLAMSVGSVDEALWRCVERGTPSPRRRLDAVRRLTDAGFAVGVLMAPVLPGLTDSDEQIDATVGAIARAGAASITPIALHLRPGAREWYQQWLAREHPHLVDRYRRLYRNGSYLGKAYQRELSARVQAAAHRHGLAPKAAGTARAVEPDSRQRAQPTQLTLL